MRSLLLAAAATAVLSPPALAASPGPAGMIGDLLSGNWPVSTERKGDYLFNPLDTGTFSVALVLVPLARVHDELGGNLQQARADNGATLQWLCYEGGNIRTSFLSWGDVSPEDDTPAVSLVAMERINAPDASCATLDKAVVPDPGNDLPGIGATLADLEARFGSAKPDADGKVSYFSEATLGDEESWTVTKNVYYVVKDGVVVSVAFTQVGSE